MSERHLHEVIAQMIPVGSRVLDLGCGNGALLAHLRDMRQCTGYGIELDDAKVLECVRRGVNVIQRNLLTHALEVAQVATAIARATGLNVTLTEAMLRETARVGRTGIVSFPNFAHWPHRLAVLRGHMPVTKALPYQWYDTPNIRVATFKDFEVLARKNGLIITDSFGLRGNRIVRTLPNLLGSSAVFFFEHR